MAIDADVESIDNMIQRIRQAIQDIQHISEGIQKGIKQFEWTDDKGQEFGNAMNNIAALTQTPVSTLEEAIPKLERLKQVIEDYKATGISGE